MKKQELINQINSIHSLSDQKRVAQIKESVSWLNIYNEDNKEVFELAKSKGII